MALELDSQILELNATRQKNKSWAQKVFDLEKKLSPKYDKYMKEKNLYLFLTGYCARGKMATYMRERFFRDR